MILQKEIHFKLEKVYKRIESVSKNRKITYEDYKKERTTLKESLKKYTEDFAKANNLKTMISEKTSEKNNINSFGIKNDNNLAQSITLTTDISSLNSKTITNMYEFKVPSNNGDPKSLQLSKDFLVGAIRIINSTTNSDINYGKIEDVIKSNNIRTKYLDKNSNFETVFEYSGSLERSLNNNNYRLTENWKYKNSRFHHKVAIFIFPITRKIFKKFRNKIRLFKNYQSSDIILLTRKKGGNFMKNKKKFSFPTAYTVILIVMLVVMGLTYIIPSGKYAKLSYDTNSSKFIVELPNGDSNQYAGTQETLNKLGVNVNLKQFTSGAISKPVAIPNTYEKLAKEKTTIFGAITTFLKAPIQGLYDSIDIIAFVLVIGGLVGVINSTGAFTAGINALSKALKGKEKWMIVIIASLVALGGTTFGLAEETIAFYPIVVPIFIVAGYDAIVAIATIFLGSCIGTMAATVNPFSTIIASNIAGVSFTQGMPLRILALVIALVVTLIYIIKYGEKVKKDPTKSLIYAQKEEIEKRFLASESGDVEVEFTFRKN